MIITSYVLLENDGIEMFLGPLECAIMRAVWEGNTASPKIWRRVRETYTTARTDEIAYTTVTSTLLRLVGRGLVVRGGDKRRFVYTPAHTNEAAFIRDCISRTIWALLENHLDATRDVLTSLARGENPLQGGSNGDR